jgi:protein ImuB
VQELHLNLELATTQSNRCTSTSLFTRTLRLPTPMLDAKVFLKLFQLDLQAHPPGAPIVKIHLAAEPARPRALQGGLFQPVFPEPEKLELTLARIAGIVGEGRAGSVELLNTHREGAFAVQHFAPPEPASVEAKVKQSVNRKQEDMSLPEDVAVRTLEEKLEENAKEKMSAVIAMRIFRPPLSASVTVREAKPVHMRCLERDIAGDIVWTAGPWRSSGDWSEQEGWSREEWDIAIAAGDSLALYRLVQDKLGGNWFVEGMYD